ncbi:hypothetical protein ACTFIW_010349 [Dictyostelium discoideum]
MAVFIDIDLTRALYKNPCSFLFKLDEISWNGEGQKALFSLSTIPGFFNIKAVQSNQELQLATEEGSYPNRIQIHFGQIQMAHLNHQMDNYSTIRINALHID